MDLDREALVLRNQKLTEAFHSTPFKHQARRQIMQSIARIPIPPARRTHVKRILLIRPDHLGDVLLSIPAVQALRAANPYAEIHMLVGPWSAQVISSFPEVDRVLTVPFPAFSRTPSENWHSPYRFALATAARLRRIGYGSALIMRPDHWWGALVAKLAGIPERIGYDHQDVLPFLTQPLHLEHQHVVQQNLRLVEKWTGAVSAANIHLTFPVDAIDKAYVDGYLEEWDLHRDQPIIAIHPGTGSRIKHWLEERWAYVADTLADQLDAPVVLTGSHHELPLAQRIAEQMKSRAIIIAGDTTIGQLAALFQRARVVLGPDSGPLHLAVAAGAPTVALYGPADPVEFGSWGSSDQHITLTSDIRCRPCRILDWGTDDPANHPCLREITAAKVLEAARTVARR